jgi:hypothetical protein
MLEKLKEELFHLHLELPKNNLVVWTGGNISARDFESGLVVIKPSGVRYEDLGADAMVVVDLDNRVVEGHQNPSSDTASHLYIYKHLPHVGGVVHTHSPYATAFAAVNKPIPVVLTAIADELVALYHAPGFALIGDEAIGKLVVESIGESSAILAQKSRCFHGWEECRSSSQSCGNDGRKRENSLASHANRQGRRDTRRSGAETSSPLHECVRAVSAYRVSAYPDNRFLGGAMMINLKDYEVWFVTGSQHLYGSKTLEQVAEHSREIAERLNDFMHIPVRVVYKDILTTTEEIRQICLAANSADRCVGLISWMHTFSPAKMWIAGLSLLKVPFLHLHTQYNREIPWSEIDMDFMNLNQSAHGDREFGFIGSRMRLDRKVVVGYWQDQDVHAAIGTWARAACAWADWQGAKIARFGDNMREVAVTEGDKVEAQIRLGFSVTVMEWLNWSARSMKPHNPTSIT